MTCQWCWWWWWCLKWPTRFLLYWNITVSCAVSEFFCHEYRDTHNNNGKKGETNTINQGERMGRVLCRYFKPSLSSNSFLLSTGIPCDRDLSRFFFGNMFYACCLLLSPNDSDSLHAYTHTHEHQFKCRQYQTRTSNMDDHDYCRCLCVTIQHIGVDVFIMMMCACLAACVHIYKPNIVIKRKPWVLEQKPWMKCKLVELYSPLQV